MGNLLLAQMLDELALTLVLFWHHLTVWILVIARLNLWHGQVFEKLGVVLWSVGLHVLNLSKIVELCVSSSPRHS